MMKYSNKKGGFAVGVIVLVIAVVTILGIVSVGKKLPPLEVEKVDQNVGSGGRVQTSSGGISALTPWTSAIDGAGYDLTSVGSLTSTNISVTNATSSGKLNIPSGAAPSVVTTGDVAIDTTSSQLVGFGASAKKVYGNGNIYAGFTYATSTAWTATSTIPLGTARVGETWNDVQCYTDVGTLNVSFNDGTNRMDMFNASTTVGTVGFTTNNTFTSAEKRYVDVGTPASSPTKISCTVSRSITAD